jgi:ABC-2 type transport system permease protein
MSAAEAAMTGGIGMVLILVVYLNLVSAYVARREELVLKRLRTGEVPDREILVGTALPAAGLALAQCVLLVVAGVALLHLGAPERPELLVLGVVLGIVLLTALAAVTSAVTQTVESVQITTMPMFVISMAGSGLFVPLEVMPEKLASICELLPLTGVMTLVRAGWLGGADAKDLLGAALTTLAWTAISVFAVQRWFRWEPRR